MFARVPNEPKRKNTANDRLTLIRKIRFWGNVARMLANNMRTAPVIQRQSENGIPPPYPRSPVSKQMTWPKQKISDT